MAQHSRDPALSRSPVDCLDGTLHRSCAGSLQGFLEGLGSGNPRGGDRDCSAYCQGRGRVRRGLIAPRSGSNPVHCPGSACRSAGTDLIQPDSEQFRTVPRTQGAVAGTLDPSSGDAPRRTRGRRERDHDAPHSPSAPQLAVPGIGFPQNFSVAQDMLDSRAFRDWSDDRFDTPPQPIDRIAWRPSARQWLASRW